MNSFRTEQIYKKNFSFCSLEKVDKKLFLIGSLLDKKFKEVLAKLQNDTSSSREESTIKVIRKIDCFTFTFICRMTLAAGRGSFTKLTQPFHFHFHLQNDSGSSKEVIRKIDPTLVKVNVVMFDVRGSLTFNSAGKVGKE